MAPSMADELPPVLGPDLDTARTLVHRSRRIVVLTGAGISTDSGIQDFRGPQGLWTKDPEAEKAATLSAYVQDPELRRRAWQNRLTSPVWQAQPNKGHAALVDLERSGRLDTLVTQNIDGLHAKAGTDPARLIEIHGTASEVICLRCGHRQPAEPVHARVMAGELDPACTELARGSAGGGGAGSGGAGSGGAGSGADAACGGILKSAVISFGQDLVAADLRRAERAAAECDLLLAVGSTLGVYPAAGLVPIAARRGAVVVIMNGGPTELDGLADVVVYGSLSEQLPALVAGIAPAPASG
jgi:NAD-dependent deacetylase